MKLYSHLLLVAFAAIILNSCKNGGTAQTAANSAEFENNFRKS